MNIRRRIVRALLRFSIFLTRRDRLEEVRRVWEGEYVRVSHTRGTEHVAIAKDWILGQYLRADSGEITYEKATELHKEYLDQEMAKRNAFLMLARSKADSSDETRKEIERVLGKDFLEKTWSLGGKPL